MKKAIVIKLLFISTLFIVGSSCKKYSKELTTVNFHILNPISGEGFEGVKVKILQQKEKGSGLTISQETETIWEGITDTEGKATYSFKCYNNQKYVYWPVVEKEFLESNNHKLLKQPDYQEAISKNDLNIFEYEATVPAFFRLQFKNDNCQGSSDIFRIRYRWQYHSNQFGCYDSGVSSLWDSYNDYFICEYEVERLGVSNTYLDTFYISPYAVDTFKVFY